MNVRRLTGIAALGLGAATMVLVPSAAAEEVTYGAASTGQALHLSVFGQDLTAGRAVSSITSDPSATANGAGIANPLSPVGITEASVEGDGEDIAPENCEGSLPEIPGLGLGLACSSSSATVVDGDPASSATGTVGGLSVAPSSTLDTLLGDVTGEIQGGVDQLLDGLSDVFVGADEATGLDTQSTVEDLLATLLDEGTLANATIGDTKTTTETTAEAVTTTCAAEGASVNLIDVPGDVAPVATITVGESSTAVTVDRATGEATTAVNPAIVHVSAPTLGIDVGVEVGQTVDIPLPEPLGMSRVIVADGAEGTDDEGNTTATASAVRIELLTSEALMGGITLALADCASVAGLTITEDPAPKLDPTPEPAPEPEPEPALPKTGGSGLNGWAVGAAVLLSGLGIGLLRRSTPTS